ncbi:7075_t:CDS:2, partial [Gigaspora margarita]
MIQYRKEAEIENADKILSLEPWCKNEDELEKNEEKEFGVKANKYKGVKFEKVAFLNYQESAKLNMVG